MFKDQITQRVATLHIAAVKIHFLGRVTKRLKLDTRRYFQFFEDIVFFFILLECRV